MTPVGTALRRLRGDYEEDPWGLDEGFVGLLQPALDLLQDDWWQVRVDGTGRVPVDGPAILVGNRGGPAPWPEVMLATAITRTWAQDEAVRSGRVRLRRPRFAVFDGALGVPFTGVAVRRLGGVPAGPGDVARLLGEGQTVIVLPPDSDGIHGAWSARRGMERFARFGFMEAALDAGVPVLPVGISGSHLVPRAVRALPGLRGAARLAGAALAPLDLVLPAPGRAGLPPLGTRWRMSVGEPLDLSCPDLPDPLADRGRVLELAELARAQIARERARAHAGPAALPPPAAGEPD